MKTEVYTWRLSAETKAALEMAARREKSTVSALLDRLTGQWIEQRRSGSATDDAEQARLHKEAMKAIGTIAGKNPERAETVRLLVRQRLARKHDRNLSR